MTPARLAAQQKQRARTEKLRAAFLENVTDMINTGCTHPEMIATRLETNTLNLRRQLDRLGRGDLLARMDRVDGQRKTSAA